MYLKSIFLQNFRSYKKATFDFNNETTFIVGPNTSGKTNIIEAIYLLSTGKSFRAEKDVQLIIFGQDIARVRVSVLSVQKTPEIDEIELEVVLTTGIVGGKEAPLKKYLVNGVSKRRFDFAGMLSCVLFSPIDLEIIVGSPGKRREFLDHVLEQVDREYRHALSVYIKALRQRNALLEHVQEGRRRNEELFEYWDEILITNGNLVTQKREAFIDYINTTKKEVFDCTIFYDKSIVSKERLLQYKDAEVRAGVTLVGPHRDDFILYLQDTTTKHDIKQFGSRGQQRLAVLQIKLIQIQFMEQAVGYRPLLLLDDIFSELDEQHIELVMSMLGQQQTILTGTHKEFINLNSPELRGASMIELKKPNG